MRQNAAKEEKIMMTTCFGIRCAILGNEKRLKKIGACKTAREKREQIEKYIVAEILEEV